MVDRPSDNDEALTRLRASDPATGSHPDLHTLRRLIGAKAPASMADADTAVPVRDDLMRGPRVRAPWIAAAAVAALGIGAGGYALGAQGDGAPTVASRGGGSGNADTDEMAGGGGGDARPELIKPGASSDEDTAVGGAGASSSASGSGRSGPAAAGDKMAAGYDLGPVRLTAGPGLPTDHGTGQIVALTSSASPTDFLAGWAEELGLEGRPVEGDGMFGPNALVDVDGMRVLTATVESGGLSFTYEDILGSPYCASMFEGMDEESRANLSEEWATRVGADVPLPDPSQCKPVDGARPSDEDALATAQAWLASTGLDLSAYEVKVSDYQDTSSATVQIEGLPDSSFGGQQQLFVQVGPYGVFSGNGTYGEKTSLGEYPLISAVEAVERSRERLFGGDYAVSLPETVEPSTADMTMPAPQATLPDITVEPGMKLPLLLKDKTVVSAELVQGYLWAHGVGNIQVPTWKLTTEDGMTYPVLALAEEAIDWTAWE